MALATLTPGPERGPWSFPVVRQPSPRRFLSLLRGCDVHLQANLSLKYVCGPLGSRRFFVTHQNDYAATGGGRGLRGRLKLACARLVHGAACSRYIARQVGCREVIGNPYDNSIFRRQAPLDRRDREIVFLGRLVSDKGCDTLLEALAILKQRRLSPSCTVIGAGPERQRLPAMTTAFGLEASVRFLGALQGAAIAGELNRHRIMAVPSRYCEPFGIVALEGLACGCLPDRLGARRPGRRDRQPRPDFSQWRSVRPGRSSSRVRLATATWRAGSSKAPRLTFRTSRRAGLRGSTSICLSAPRARSLGA